MPTRRTLTEAERQASGWIVRMKADDVSAREREAFRAWLNADPTHAKAYAKFQRTWDLVASLDHLKGRATGRIESPRRWIPLATAIAASVLLVVGALAWFSRVPAPPAERYATNPAEVRTIELADGSTVVLSGGSEATVAFTDGERRVDLAAGYALFDVRHDPERPFVVHTPRGDIRVLGTSFVIRVGEDQVRTTVLRGSVSGAAARTGLLSVLGPGGAVTAEANEEILLNDEGARVVAIAADVIPRRLAWQDGMLAFDGETLNEAIAEVSRQTGWRFELADPELGQMRVGGYVSAEPEAFIGLLSSSLNLDAERVGPRHVVITRRPPG